MAVKQLKSKYVSSFLGIFWAVLNPVLIASVVTFVFTVVFRVGMNNFGLFILSGMFPWIFFSQSLTEATGSILAQQNILRQFSLPKEVLPLASVLSNFLNYLIGWLMILPIFLFLNPKIIVLFPFFVLILLLNLIFAWGLGLIFSVLNIFFRDVASLLGVLLMLWLWGTPVFYSRDMVPVNFGWIFDFNPMSSFVDLYRELIFFGNFPSLFLLLRITVWTFASIFSGLWIFSRLESKILKYI